MSVIALDAMGGDIGPPATVVGALTAAAEGIEVVLVGDAEVLGQELTRHGNRDAARMRVVHAADAVEMGDKAARAVRSNRETPLYVGSELVKRGEAQALVSMGNTGAAMATALVVLGRLPGVERPALGAVLPGGPAGVLFLDIGANADARSSHLVQFAHIGAAYMHAVHGLATPRVALLSIGEEPSKGSNLVLDTHQALATAGAKGALNFIGNVESGELLTGRADVIVTDGFTGNVSLKLAEGIIQLLFGELRNAAHASLQGRLGGALLLPSLHVMRKSLDYHHYGAVPLLGVDGAVFIGHGRSDADAVAGALRTARHALDQGMLTALAAAIAPEEVWRSRSLARTLPR